MMAFELTSPAFGADAEIPRKYTCDGEDVSPPLEWADAPDDTAALALICDDPDARGWIHWLVFDMDGSQSGGLAEGLAASPDAPAQGQNDFRRIGWGGPCPPSGTHRYRFTLYALDDRVGLSGSPTADELRSAMQGHVLGEAELTAKYTRQR
jgi:Raf kinase inhibitor-like YbhB/YbcL family protein